jgi:hypothetical protein
MRRYYTRKDAAGYRSGAPDVKSIPLAADGLYLRNGSYAKGQDQREVAVSDGIHLAYLIQKEISTARYIRGSDTSLKKWPKNGPTRT